MFYNNSDNWIHSSSVWLLPAYHPFRLLNTVSFFSNTLLVPYGYVMIFKFCQTQDSQKKGLSERVLMSRKRRNLVNVKFNLFNWILDTSCILLVLVSSEEFQIVYLLFISCGPPLLYFMGMEDNRKATKNYFHSRMRIFRTRGKNHILSQCISLICLYIAEPSVYIAEPSD